MTSTSIVILKSFHIWGEIWTKGTFSTFYVFSIFFNYQTPGYGNCFAFNKNDIAADPEAGERKASLTGPKFGLSLVLNIQPHDYMTNGRTEQVLIK